MTLRSLILTVSAITMLALASLGLSPLAPSWAASAAPVRAPFDGAWSVLIVTDAGTCDRAYRYAFHIVNGRITYNDPSFNVSGHVDPRGHVNVMVAAGEQRANGSGTLTGDSGEGQWSGSSSSSDCSGHWEAERRG
jgi:hypothetical protein